MCVPGTSQCNNGTPQTCDSTGAWIDDGTPCPFVCQNGACTGMCTPNDVQCMGNVPQICDADGQWQSGTACPFVCAAGVCGGECVPNDVQGCGSAMTCNAGGTKTCDSTGTWGPCTPAAGTCTTTPSGWSPVALTSGACPSGFGTPQVYVSAVSAAPYTCQCNCGGTQTCQGSGILNQYASGTCTGSPTNSYPIDFSTSCGGPGTSISIGGGNGYILSNVNFAPGPACSASPIATNKPSPSETHINVCQPDVACPSGACLDAGEIASLCVAHTGMMACPSGYTNATLVSQGVSDTRACGACGCGSTLGCTFTSLLIDNDSSCGTANPYNFTEAANTCTAAPNSYPFNADKANAMVTGSGACSETAPSNPGGGVTLDPADLLTICCP